MVLITKYYICYFDTLPPYQILYVVSKHTGTGKLTIEHKRNRDVGIVVKSTNRGFIGRVNEV